MIKTKSIYAPKEETDGTRILVTRWYPRGVKKSHFDQWLRELAPSTHLLKLYKDGIVSWDEFVDTYKREMKHTANSMCCVKQLSAYGTDVTLLCYEPDGQNCHRYLLKELIEMEAKV